MDQCGFDLGKLSSHYCIRGAGREIVEEGKVSMKPDALKKKFSGRAPMRIVVECSGKAFWVADFLETMGHTVVVVDASRTKAIASARIKNDTLDARMLSQLAAIDFLVPVERASKAQRLDKMRLRIREGLVRRRAELINMVRSLVDSEGGFLRGSSPAGFAKAVRGTKLPKGVAGLLAPLLDAIDAITKNIETAEEAVLEWAERDETAQLLQTAPGVGPIVAAGFVSVVRDPARFKSGRQIAAYFGLVPKLYESGQTSRKGSITKAGSAQGRWLLSIAANAVLRTRAKSALQTWGHSLQKKTGRKTAVVAVARKMAVLLWTMWRTKTNFQPRLPESAAAAT